MASPPRGRQRARQSPSCPMHSRKQPPAQRQRGQIQHGHPAGGEGVGGTGQEEESRHLLVGVQQQPGRREKG